MKCCLVHKLIELDIWEPIHRKSLETLSGLRSSSNPMPILMETRERLPDLSRPTLDSRVPLSPLYFYNMS